MRRSTLKRVIQMVSNLLLAFLCFIFMTSCVLFEANGAKETVDPCFKECNTTKDCCGFITGKRDDRRCEPIVEGGPKFCLYCAYSASSCKYYPCCVEVGIPDQTGRQGVACSKKTQKCVQECDYSEIGFCTDQDGYKTSRSYIKCNKDSAVTCNGETSSECGLAGRSCGKSGDLPCCRDFNCKNGKCARKCASNVEWSGSDHDVCTPGNCCVVKGKTADCFVRKERKVYPCFYN